jgi:hypothetical protein
MEQGDPRQAALERRVRRLGGLVAMLGCGWLVLLAWMLAPRPRLEAREFVVFDSTGTRRASLGLRDDGSPVLHLDDARGRPRIYAVVLPGGRPSLRLTDSAWVHRATLETSEDQRPRLDLRGADGRVLARLAVEPDDRGHLMFEPAGPRERPAAR